jgi:hypothetical protein
MNGPDWINAAPDPEERARRKDLAHAANYGDKAALEEIREHTRVCDFCQAPGARWNMPAESFIFEADSTIGSDGAWAACDACRAFIEDDDQSGLIEYIVQTFMRRHPMPARFWKMVKARVEPLIKQYWAARTGPAVPFMPSIDGDTQRS